MAWFKVDDQLHTHPKSRRAGLDAMGLWGVSGSFCMAYKTSGFVPGWFVASWPKGKALAVKLVTAGLWDESERDGESGWYFHDWEHHQPSDDEIERSREYARDRQRKRRRRLAEARESGGDKP